MKITKAIIPVAGFGTRFLPATKAQPKEMLALVDKPIVQFLVEEAVNSGIEEICFVTCRGKQSIENHFDCNFELEQVLERKNKIDALAMVRHISKLAKFSFVRQPLPLGDGDALLRARHLIGNEPCAVLFGDDIVDAEKPCIGQLIDIFAQYQNPVLALMRVDEDEVSNFGVVDGPQLADRVYDIKNMVEKPKKEEAPSNLIIVGKYVITPEVFNYLATAKPGKDGEIRLADAFIAMLQQETVLGYEFEGRRYDCGSKLGFVEATVDFALKHPEIKDKFKEFLQKKAL